ncbi:MAG: thioredoxin [SAR324 cluster bacterium]|nr:thioredoxin [SAR324 cluster bacterium]
MASEKVHHLTDSNFDDQIKSGMSLVDFWAEWCAPCVALGPTIDRLAETYDGKVKVNKVDIDKNQALPARYGIRSIPTVMLFKDGEALGVVTGNDPNQIEKMVQQHVN